MAYVHFMNASNPIWDFLSEVARSQEQAPRDRHQRGPPGAWGWSPFDEQPEHGPWAREMPHRPHHHHPGHGRRGHGRHDAPSPAQPQPQAQDDARSATLQAEDTPIDLLDNEKDTPAPDPEISTPAEEPANSSDEAENYRHGRHHGCGEDFRGFGWGHGPAFVGRGGGWGHHGRGGMRGPCGRPRGGPWGFPHRRHPYGRHNRRFGNDSADNDNPFAPLGELLGAGLANFDPERLRSAFAEALQTAATTVHPGATRGTTNDDGEGRNGRSKEQPNKDIDFVPNADIYDAAEEYVVHFALPGAKKENISLNWDAEKSELHVSGFIARDGDEETMKTLALDERDVGLFERRVKLGREAVDAEGIAARMENGLLVVKVPKRLDDEWTEVKQVDIE